MNTSSPRRSKQRSVVLSYEKTCPWEEEQGTTFDRVSKVNAEAKRVSGHVQPPLALDRSLDPAIGDHLQDVGRHVLILRDAAKQSRKETGAEKNSLQSSKRVIPARFPEVTPDSDEENVNESDQDLAMMDERIAIMLMDEEWDTRAWNSTKIQTAIETLYHEIEHSEDDSRRELATTMLLRLLETHEDAVDYVETSLPSLVNKAFRTLSKVTKKTQVFRMVQLVAVLAEWFAHVLSSENVVHKASEWLLRETELCARILQHHWRGVLFQRTVKQRDYDPIVRTRLRSMHLIKYAELRHQFKVFRQAVGPQGLPNTVVQAYITILYHLVKLQRGILAISSKTRNAVLSNQRYILGSGLLVYLSSLITPRQSRKVIDHVMGIVSEIIDGHGDEHIVDILQCNIVQRVQLDVTHIIRTSGSNPSVDESALDLTRSLHLLHAIATKVLLATERWKHRVSSMKDQVVNTATIEEEKFLLRKLDMAVKEHFVHATAVFNTMFEALSYCREKDTQRVQILETMALLSRSLGFSHLLEVLTRCGGRRLEQLLMTCMQDRNPVVVQAAVALFYEMTNHSHGRHGLTTAGAVPLLLRWCGPSLEASESHMTFVMGLIGCTLLARQRELTKSATTMLTNLKTLDDRLAALYTLFLDLALDKHSPHAMDKTALYLLETKALPLLVQFLLQVSPSCMESSMQTFRQRHISCILLSRLCKVPQVMRACFSEDLVNHLALSIQCNRLDTIERVVASSSRDDRFVAHLGAKEACKALSRLAQCPSDMVNARLRPSPTSSQVPEWPQALICDVMFRMHVLVDVVALIQRPKDTVEFAQEERDTVIAAVELAGRIRPLPYGESVREKFLKTHAKHPHGVYSQSKVLQLVGVTGPSILQLLRDQSAGLDLVSACCIALSRLACTNAACCLLLRQGCLHTALIHLPEILVVSDTESRTPKAQSVDFELPIDDYELLNVPAALYTLFGKLCAVAEGRTGLMRAQVLPRLLKRMQLRHPTSRVLDDDCKSAIACIISRLAMVNAVEGSTSELFGHFRVLDILAKILEQERELVRPLSSPLKKKRDQVPRWRLLTHAVNAIAALSQDVLVCVPRVVALGIVELLFPFLTRRGRDKNFTSPFDMLQYDAVTIIHSIASYPFGKYHTYLTSVQGAEVEQSIDDDKKKRHDHTLLTSTLMERIKGIGYDFAMELETKPMISCDKKSVGELARETMALINEQLERQEEQGRKLSGSKAKNEHFGRITMASHSVLKNELSTRASFPALPQPLGHPLDSKVTKSIEVRQEALLDTKASNTPLILVLENGSKSPVSLNGVDIASTRPTETNNLRQERGHYVFTRPKAPPKRREQDAAYRLMLDPLFDSNGALTHLRKRHDLDDLGEDEGLNCSYKFSQAIDHCGHYVNVKARRSKRGDRYFPSLGRIVTSDASLSPNDYKRSASTATRLEQRSHKQGDESLT